MNRIDYLLQRYLDRKETAEERTELMELIASGHYRDVIEDKFAERLMNGLPEADGSVDDVVRQDLQEVRGRIPTQSPKGKTVRMDPKMPWFRAAAAVLLVAVCFAGWRYTAPAPERVAGGDIVQTASVTSSEGITKVILADGTLVWLKGSSTITYPASFTNNTRDVVLEGEALFEVSKDADRPFIIQCGDLKTTVLGTSFNIKAMDDNIEVLVLTGKVALSADANAENLVVLPNEKALYKGAEKQLMKIEAPPKVEERIAVLEGTEYTMTFEDTPMDVIVERVEDKFNVSVSYKDPKMANCRMTADFTDQSLEKTLLLIAKALTIEYEINGTEITLIGDGCDQNPLLNQNNNSYE